MPTTGARHPRSISPRSRLGRRAHALAVRLRRVIPIAATLAWAVSCQDVARPGSEVPRAPAPAAIESETIVLSPTGDTYLDLNAVNFSTDPRVLLYTWPDHKIANAIVMKFDLTSVPPEATISSATLNLYLTDTDATADPTYTVTAHKIVNRNPVVASATGETYDGSNGWEPNTCCSGNIPMAQADIGPAVDTRAINKSPGFKQWDVTALVQGWHSNPSTNFGLLLNSDPSKLADRWRYFSSKDHGTAGQRPHLEIVYTVEGGGGGDYPNEPAGATVLFDEDADFGNAAWRDSLFFAVQGASNLATVTDVTAPNNPNIVGRIRFPAGSGGGESPAALFTIDHVPPANWVKLYLYFTLKYGTPFDFVSSGLHKVFNAFYGSTSANNLIIETHFPDGGVGNPLAAWFVNGQGSHNYQSNGSEGHAVNEWATYEFVMTRDGSRVEGWLNGVKRIDDTHPAGTANENINEMGITPVWGGAQPGETVGFEGFWYINHLRWSYTVP